MAGMFPDKSPMHPRHHLDRLMLGAIASYRTQLGESVRTILAKDLWITDVRDVAELARASGSVSLSGAWVIVESVNNDVDCRSGEAIGQ